MSTKPKTKGYKAKLEAGVRERTGLEKSAQTKRSNIMSKRILILALVTVIIKGAWGWLYIPTSGTEWSWMYDNGVDPPMFRNHPAFPTYRDISPDGDGTGIKIEPYNDRVYRYFLPDYCCFFNRWHAPGDELFISPNGWIGFDNPLQPGYPSPPFPTLLNPYHPNELIAVLWQDNNPTLTPEPSTDNRVYYYYDTDSKVLTVQWHNVRTNSENVYDYEVMLQLGDENSSVPVEQRWLVHCLYNTANKGWDADNGIVGFENHTGEKGILYRGTLADGRVIRSIVCEGCGCSPPVPSYYGPWGWSNVTVSYNEQREDVPYESQIQVPKVALTVEGSYACKSLGNRCSPTYEWTVSGPDNFSVGADVLSDPCTFGFSPPQSGIYTVTITPFCDGFECIPYSLMMDVVPEKSHHWVISLHSGCSFGVRRWGPSLIVDAGWFDPFWKLRPDPRPPVLLPVLELYWQVGYTHLLPPRDTIESGSSYLLNTNLDLRAKFLAGKRVSTFIGLGPGYYRLGTTSSNELGLNGCTGVDFKLAPRLSLEIGGNFHYLFDENNTMFGHVAVGILYGL